MRYFIVLMGIVALSLFNACADATQKNSVKPSDLIPRDTLVPLLKEITLLESFYQNNFGHISLFHQALKRAGLNVLNTYHITYNRYERSMDYYGSHLFEMQSIYREVLDSLNREASILESIPENKRLQETASGSNPMLPSPF
jgi:hypothetical protein